MAESTLGMSSLDRLRELKEENERRQAVGRRQILELPIGDVHPDPHQVRTDFAADVVAADDHEDLEGWRGTSPPSASTTRFTSAPTPKVDTSSSRASVATTSGRI